MNSGAPTSAMIAPTGSWRGLAAIRATTSAAASRVPPSKARGRRHDPVIAGAEDQPHGVRRDQPDESHRAGADHRDGGERRAGDEYDACATRSTSRPTLRARSSPAASTLSGRASSNRESTTASKCAIHTQRRALRPAQIAGEPEHHAPHAGPNPRPARSTLISAPQALASTTPVSSRRDVPPPRASR